MEPYFIVTMLCLYLSILVTGVEYIKIRPVFTGGNLLEWKMLRLRSGVFTGSLFSGLFDRIYNRHINILFWAMVVLPLSGIAFVVLYERYQLSSLFTAQVVVMNSILLLNNFRSRYALDGADQFNTIAITALSICLLLRPQDFEVYFLGFIAFQLTLSYFMAGIFKVFSVNWLSGKAISDVFNGKVYGSRFIAGVFKRWPVMRIVLSVTVITWEVLFPFSFFLPEDIFFCFLGVGVGFHLFNAVFMGLNCFFLSFVSGYPALVFVYYFIRQISNGGVLSLPGF